MWYLEGLIISFFIYGILIAVRYRSYWNRVLKEPKAQNQESLNMLGEHIIRSLCVFQCLTYEEYREEILHPASLDAFDLGMFILLFIVLIVAWVIALPLLAIIWILSILLKFLKRRIDKKIEANPQSE